ncbi:MAG: DUF6090 family protein [Catalinimonas sp.]
MSARRQWREIDWVQQGVELLVVILGITIALALNNWNEGRRARRLRSQYLSQLRADLVSDSLTLADEAGVNRRSLTLADTLFRLMASGAPADTLAELTLRLTNISEFIVDGTTYERTERLDPIRDAELIMGVKRLRGQFEAVDFLERILYNYMEGDFSTLILESYDLDLSARAMRPVDLTVFGTPGYRLRIAAYFSYAQQKADAYAAAQRSIRELLAQIDD